MKDISSIVSKWKYADPETFHESVGEINQGNSIEAYFNFKNFTLSDKDNFIDLSSIPKEKIYNTIIEQYYLSN